MNYSGTVYVFDLDDTLVWSPAWYDEVVLDFNGYVVTPGRSIALKEALEFIKNSHDKNLPNFMQDMKLKVKSKKQLDDRNIYFQLVGKNNQNIRMEDLQRYFSNLEIKNSNLTECSKYSPDAAVIGDQKYYCLLDTVGSLGFNEDMLELYKKHQDNAVILTARFNVPGMNQKIHEIITKRLKPPQAIFSQPVDTVNSGRYKGEVIVGIASSPNVDLVHFYDDNLEYLMNAQKVVNLSGLNHKITMHHSDASKKPVALSRKILNLINSLTS